MAVADACANDLCSYWGKCLRPECGGDPNSPFARLRQFSAGPGDLACVFVNGDWNFTGRTYAAGLYDGCASALNDFVPNFYVWEDLGTGINAETELNRYWQS